MVQVMTQADLAKAEETAKGPTEEQVLQENAGLGMGKKPVEENLDSTKSEEDFWSNIDKLDEETPPVEDKALEQTGDQKKPEETKTEDQPKVETKTEEAETKVEETKVTEEKPAETKQEEVTAEETTAPVVDQRSPEEIKAAVVEARSKAFDKLKEQFKLSEEQAETLIRDPNEVLPALAANLYLDMFDSMMQTFTSQIPQMVHAVLNQRTVENSRNKAFYTEWPQLANKEYRQTIERIAVGYRQANPTADEATAIREIGAQAWVALRLPLDQLLQHTQGGGVTTQGQQQTKPDQQVVTTTRVPANAGGAAQVHRQTASGESNIFSDIAEELLFEEN